MKIAVIGTGYVGLVSGTCFADSGNDVVCVDIDAEKIAALSQGEVPIYEPGLEEMVSYNLSAGRLSFTTDSPKAVKPADIIYLAVGTPQGDDGAANLSALWSVVEEIAPHLQKHAIVVTKSTVPVGTNARIYKKPSSSPVASVLSPATLSFSRKARQSTILKSRTGSL